MVGDIDNRMCGGIDGSQYILVFITARFMAKVTGSDPYDNCLKEFLYAVSNKKIFVSIELVARYIYIF
jgi:hypothetical protein